MPTNVSYEYVKAEKKYNEAKTRNEKLDALEEMLSTVPKHKGTDNLQAQIKSKIAKLKRQGESKRAGRRVTTIAKEGDAQVCILGLVNSGKSTLLSKITNAKPKISNIPYTTTKPQLGTIDYHGVRIQTIEIPSTFQRMHMSIAQNSDAIVIVYNKKEEIKKMKKILEDFRIRKPVVEIQRDKDPKKSKEKIWNILGLIKIHTKLPSKKPEKKPMVLKKGATVGKAANDLHKDFYEFFKFARVWGKSAKHQGQVVGKDHILKDEDILEIHI